MLRYNELRQKYPNKHILIGEIGWPSDGPWRRGAEASQVNQAKFLRTFFNVAARERLDYYIMEAFDQPWKRTLEGTAGAPGGCGMPCASPSSRYPATSCKCRTGRHSAPSPSPIAFLPTVWFVFRRNDLKPSGQFFYAP